MARQSDVRWQDDGALGWSWRLTLLVSGGGVGLSGAAAALWARGGSAAEYAPLTVVIGVVALFVAVSGRLTTAAAVRYRAVDLPQPGSLSVVAGPGLSRRVTPQVLRIDTALHRLTVPRHLIGRFSRHGLDVRLDLTDGDHVYFRVDSPLLDVGSGSRYRTNGRAQQRTVTKIVDALDRVPAAHPGTGGTSTTRRTGTTTLAVSAAVLSTLAFTVLTIVALG